MRDAYEDFMLACQSRKLSRDTLRFYRTQLPPFVAYCTGKQATANLVRRYLVELADRGLRDTSLHAAARAIRTFLRFCEAEGIATAPRFSMPKLGKRILPALSVSEVNRLLDACQTNRDRAMLLMALDTGLRVGELANLRVSDLDGRRVTVRSGKGDKGRVVYIGLKTQRAVATHLAVRSQVECSDSLWLNQRTGGALTRWGIRELCDRLGNATGIDVFPHKLRRTAALLALRAGLPLPMLQHMLGHEHLSTTQRYLALTDDDRRQAHETFGAVDTLLDYRGES